MQHPTLRKINFTLILEKMKESTLSFLEGFLTNKGSDAKAQGKPQMAFDWDKAAGLIKSRLKQHPDLIAEAGLEGDWEYTGGTIFEDGKATNDGYTYLCSNWAKPTIIFSWGGEEQESWVCEIEESKSRFSSGSKWDKESLKILGLKSNQKLLK